MYATFTHTCRAAIFAGVLGATLFNATAIVQTAWAEDDPSTDADAAESSLAEQYAPKVKQLDDGTIIQITPSESYTDAAYYWQGGEENFVPYNTYYAKSDQRGCNSCHDDLKETLASSPYEHAALTGLDTEWTVQTCLGCHYYEPAYLTTQNTFGTMIHSIHADTANCWNCHDTDTTLDGTGSMQLWDNVKHGKLRGITPISADDMDDAFAYSQDETIDQDQLFSMNATHYEWEYLRVEKQQAGEELDPSLIDDWTITINGEVEQEKTFKLADLIENGPSETVTMKLHCLYNPSGGPAVGQVQITGIPLSYLTDQCGIKDTAGGFSVEATDGLVSGQLIDTTQGDAWLVYEINGEPLSWQNGYPVMLWLGHGSSGANLKMVTGITYCSADDPNLYVAESGITAPDENGEEQPLSRPNAGIIGLREGQVVKTGEKMTIKGYADAYDRKITAIELSMDQGQTWSHYDIEDDDTLKWVTWEYEFTPTEDTAYTIAVRAVDEDGEVSPNIVEKMFVSNADPESLVE